MPYIIFLSIGKILTYSKKQVTDGRTEKDFYRNARKLASDEEPMNKRSKEQKAKLCYGHMNKKQNYGELSRTEILSEYSNK